MRELSLSQTMELAPLRDPLPDTHQLFRHTYPPPLRFARMLPATPQVQGLSLLGHFSHQHRASVARVISAGYPDARLAMADRNYPLVEGAIFHSDRGTQYISAAFAAAANLLGIGRSTGDSGVCFDKALTESFNAAVKVERVNRTVYPTREHARKDVARYIEFRYNTQRLHSTLGY